MIMLDQRVTFQKKQKVSDGAGGNVETWVDIASTPTVWASVVTLSGAEGVDEGGTVATGEQMITIRFRDDLNEKNRIVWRGEYYNIRTIYRRGTRQHYLKIKAERGVAS